LNRAILSQGWYNLYAILKYKSEWQGKKLVRVDSRYITMECSGCHKVSIKNVDLKNRKFKCVSCGLEICMDYNAALNVRERSLLNVKE